MQLAFAYISELPINVRLSQSKVLMCIYWSLGILLHDVPPLERLTKGHSCAIWS